MREAGFYWIRMTEPGCDRGGIIAEPWGQPEVARYDGLHWFGTETHGQVADQIDVQVLSGKLESPSPPGTTALPASEPET